MQASDGFFLKALKKSLFHFPNDLHGQPALILAKQPQILGGGDTSENSWWGCAARFFRSCPDFRPKNVIFHSHFQIRTLKSIPSRPGL